MPFDEATLDRRGNTLVHAHAQKATFTSCTHVCVSQPIPPLQQPKRVQLPKYRSVPLELSPSVMGLEFVPHE